MLLLSFPSLSSAFARLHSFSQTPISCLLAIKDWFEHNHHLQSTRTIILCLVATIVALFLFCILPVQQWWIEFLLWMDTLGDWAPVVFILVYAACTVLCFPVGLFTIASGLIFGMWKGTITSWAGSILGSSIAFILGQKIFQSCVEEMAERYPPFMALDKAIAQNAWKIVFLLRLSPLVPFNIFNYLLSLTSVKFLDYTMATAVGLVIPTVLWVYVGTAAKNFNDLIANPSSRGTVVFFFGGILTICSIVFVTQLSAKVIKKEIEIAKQKDAKVITI